MRAAEEAGRRTPLLLKVAPDLDEAGLNRIIEITKERGVDGLIIANTTVNRPPLEDAAAYARSSAGFPGGRCSKSPPR